MTGIDIFAWLVLVVIIISIFAGFVALALLPGKIAVKNHHPQVAAINMASWLGLLFTFGIVWVLAMVWASMVPADSAQADGLKQRINALEEKARTQEERVS